MSKTATVRARIEPGLKTEVDDILDEMGVTPTQVITMLYKQIQRKRDLPLDLHIPNRETAQAIREARKGKGVVKKDIDELFEDLDN